MPAASREFERLGSRLRDPGLVVLLAWSLSSPTLAPAQDTPSPSADAALAALRSENVEARRDAATFVRNADRTVQRQALPALIEILKSDKDGQVRLATLDALTFLGPDAAPAIDALVHTLKTDYGGQQKEELHQDYRSALALAAIGKPAVDALRALLDHKKESVRAEVLMALGRIGPDASPAVPDLIPKLADPSARIRAEASEALARIGPAAVEPLIEAASNADPHARAAALAALAPAPSDDPRARAAVYNAASDENPEVRAAAIHALANLESDEAALAPLLLAALAHADPSVRRAALDALADKRSLLDRLAPDLDPLLALPDPGAARDAAFLIHRLGPDAATPRLLDALRRDGSHVEPIADALALIGRTEADRLTSALDDPSPAVRRGAALALAGIRPLAPGTVERLGAGLSDPDPAVRATFLDALGPLGPRARPAVAAVRGLLADPDPEVRLRTVAVLAACAARDSVLAEDLTSLLSDTDPAVRRRSLETLAALGPPGRTALPAVAGHLDPPEPVEIRLAALAFLAGHGPAAESAVPAIASLLSDDDPRLRLAAVQTLGQLGRTAQPALDRLTALLDASDEKVRQAVVATLGALELDAEVLHPHLARALRDPENDVRRAAMRGIQRLGPRAVLFVPDLILVAENASLRNNIERMLGRFEKTGPDPTSIPELVEALDHQSETVRGLAAKFLGLAGDAARDALPALERLKADPSEPVRKQAEAACQQIQTRPGSEKPDESSSNAKGG